MGAFTTEIQALYVAYFNRPADSTGLAYWDSIVTANGGDLSGISAAFAGSTEYTATFAGLSSDQIVANVYTNLFGRAAEPAGLLFWSLALAQGKITIDKIVTQIAAGAQGTDLDAYNAKVSAATIFTNALDTTAEILGYSGAAANIVAKAYVASVTDAATLANAIAPAALQATITNVVAAHDGSVGAGVPFSLTAGIDTFVGTAANDTVNSLVTAGLSALDNIDGAGGSNVLNVTDTAAITTSVSTTVKNFQTANLVSAHAVTANTSAWTGLTKLVVAEVGGGAITSAGTTVITLTDSAQGGNTISVNGGSSVGINSVGATASGTITVGAAAAPTGTINIARTTNGAVNAGAINVAGGTTVNISQTANNTTVNMDQTNGFVSVLGGAATTTVNVSSSAAVTHTGSVAGVVANAVNIQDVNAASATAGGTITSVTASNFTTLAINDNALTTLSVTGGSGNIIIDNSGLTTATNKTLALTINGETGGTLDDADIYTTLNITTATAASTLANITTGAVTALTVAGTKGLTLTSAAGLSALKTITVTGSAGLTASGFAGTLTSIDTSGTTGASKVTINGSTTTFNGGAGADTVTLATGSTKAVSLGAGDDSLTVGALVPTAALGGGLGTDTLSIDSTAAGTASGSATFAGLVTGFERLVLTGATNQTIDLSVLGNFTYASTSGGNGLTLHNLNTGGTLALTGAGTAYTIDHSPVVVTTTDVLNLVLTADASGAGTNFASTGITAGNVGTVNITSTDTETTPAGAHDHMVTLLGNVAKAITVTGNNGLTLTATDTALTSVDAHGITLGGFTYTSGALAGAAAILGSATGTNVVDMTAATAGIITYTGGTGADTVTIAGAKADVINLGSGTTANTVTGGSATGSVTVTSTATGTEAVTLGSGNNIVNLGNGVNTFTASSGNNTYTGGTGVDTVHVGGGVNTITTGTGADVVDFTSVIANGNSYSTITDAHSGMKISLSDSGVSSGTATFTSAKLSLADTAVFQDYLDAGTASAGTQTNSNLSWFQFAGNTYIVEDNSSATTYQNAGDTVVKLVGLVDLSTATFTTVFATSGSLTLA